jgi:hypothetical protein
MCSSVLYACCACVTAVVSYIVPRSLQLNAQVSRSNRNGSGSACLICEVEDSLSNRAAGA